MPERCADRAEALLAEVESFAPDLVHILGHEDNPAHGELARRASWPVVFSWDGGPVGSPAALPFLRACTALVYPGGARPAGLPDDLLARVRSRRRAVRTDLFRPGAGGQRPYHFLLFASWAEDAGQDLVARAMTELNATALIVGDDYWAPSVSGFRDLVRRQLEGGRPVPHCCHSPTHEFLPVLYNSGQVLLWADRQPGRIHPRIVHEALACGLPVVGFQDCLPELPGVTRVGSSGEFLRAADACRQEPLRARQGAQGRAFVEHHCRFEEQYTAFHERLYRNLALGRA
jgi:hypothetical protein